MKDLIIKNIADIQANVQEKTDTTFNIKSVIVGNYVNRGSIVLQ